MPTWQSHPLWTQQIIQYFLHLPTLHSTLLYLIAWLRRSHHSVFGNVLLAPLLFRGKIEIHKKKKWRNWNSTWAASRKEDTARTENESVRPRHRQPDTQRRRDNERHQDKKKCKVTRKSNKERVTNSEETKGDEKELQRRQATVGETHLRRETQGHNRLTSLTLSERDACRSWVLIRNRFKQVASRCNFPKRPWNRYMTSSYQ